MRFQVKLSALVAIVLLAVPLFASADTLTIGATNNQWIEWARVAWEYFQPGLYVNQNTGLHYAASGWPHFTDWDLGTYVEAIIDAEKLGIISQDGSWGANYRLEKVLRFLETRSRTNDNLPCHQYNADTGNADSYDAANPSDSAKLLLSLDDLRRFRSEYAQRINALVAGYNFQKLADSNYFSNNDIYPPYAAQGYWAFNYSTPKLRAVESLGNGVFLNVYNETLPQSRITSEPLMLAILEDRATGLYRTYADRTFSAQQKRFEATGKLTAFSEGAYGFPYYYVYEWIVNDKGETWAIYSGAKINAVPIIYTKIAFAFHAIYNNQYTSQLVNELSSLQATRPLGGFYEGKSEEGTPLKSLTDKTNGIILAAARYYVTHTSTTSSTTSSVTTSSSSTTSSVTTTTSTTTSPLTTETTATSLSTETTSATTGPPTTQTSATSMSTVTSSTTQTTESPRPPTPPCVIATATYGSEMAPEVAYMRYVRDKLIGSTPTGKVLRDGFNNFYYSWSPALAGAIAGSEPLRALFRVLLLPLAGIVHVAALSFGFFGGSDLASIMAFAIAALLVMSVYMAVPVLFLTLAVRKIKRRSV